MIFTGGLLIVTARAAKSWKEQKLPDMKRKTLYDMIKFYELCGIYYKDTKTHLKYLEENNIKMLSHMSIIDTGFKFLKLFDADLSLKLEKNKRNS